MIDMTFINNNGLMIHQFNILTKAIKFKLVKIKRIEQNK